MGHDIQCGAEYEHQLHLNIAGWEGLQKLLREHGFEGELPGYNDGETVSKETAKDVGAAMLRFYRSKCDADPDAKLPELTRLESTCLAYALMLCWSDGEAEHF